MNYEPRENEQSLEKNTYKIMIKPLVFVVSNILLFILFDFFAFKQNINFLFYGLDGHYMLTLMKNEILWRGVELGLSSNFLQSLGDIWFPMNGILIPGYLILNLIPSIVFGEIFSYIVFSLEMFLFTIFLSRFMGLKWIFSLMAGWALPALIYPYFEFPKMYGIMLLVPHIGTSIILTGLILILFFDLGRHNFKRTLFNIFGIIVFSMYISLAFPAIVTICGPIIFIMTATYLFCCPSRREIKIKIISCAVILILSEVIGLLSFVYGLTKYTAAYYLGSEMYNDRMSFNFASLLFNGSYNTWLFILSSFGMFLYLIYENRYRKSICLGVIISAISIVSFGILMVYFNFWHGPSPLYYEFYLWPFYIVFSFYFLQVCVQKAQYFVKINMVAFEFFLFLMILAFLVVNFLQYNPKASQESYSFQPIKTPIVKILNKKISLIPGEEFKGRVANFTGRKMNKDILWFDLYQQDSYILNKTGNDHRMVGFWFYNIPTLDVYNPLISPTYYKFTTNNLAFSSDRQVRNCMVLRKLNFRLLNSLGVRYIVTDSPILERQAINKLSIDEKLNLFLYELNNPNLGQYSPTQVIQESNNKKILDLLNDKKFDPSSEIIVDHFISDKLVKAKVGKIYVEKGAIRIIAQSEGFSLLLLPLQYSHCLTITSHQSQEKPIIFRANLMQTAVLFHRSLSASIRYFTGPFYHSGCRLADAKDYERYELSSPVKNTKFSQVSSYV